MANYALISNHIVGGIIVAEQAFIDGYLPSSPYDEAVPVDDWTGNPPKVGCYWDGVDFTDPDPVYRSALSKEEFFSRFTDTEYGALLRLSRADTAIGERVAGFLRILEILGAIDVTEDRVVAGFQFFVDQGWLTEARRDELLAPVAV